MTEQQSQEPARDPWAAVDAQVADDTSAAAAQPEPEPTAEPTAGGGYDSLPGEIAAGIAAIVAALAPAMPTVAALYPPETREAVGQSIAEVCRKHGWLSGGLFGDYGAEIACAATVLPLAFATVAAYRHDRAAWERARNGQPAASDAPSARSEPSGGGEPIGSVRGVPKAEPDAA